MASTSKTITRIVMMTLVMAGILTVLADAAQQAKPLKIGMSNSFFKDKDKSVVDIAADDFKDVLKKTTSLAGELTSTLAAAEIADKMNAKQLDMGIFYAHEFAALQKKYPDFQPLLIADNKGHPLRAYFVVHKNNPAKTVADLRGKKLDLPKGTTEISRQFLAKHCADKFFDAIEKSKSPEEGLNQVAREKVQITVVNMLDLESYKDIRGPVFTNNLRVLQESEIFPPNLIAYKQGAIDQATLTQFRDGLIKAHELKEGRDMMKEWGIDVFEAIPKDYAKRLADVLTAYPPR